MRVKIERDGVTVEVETEKDDAASLDAMEGVALRLFDKASTTDVYTPPRSFGFNPSIDSLSYSAGGGGLAELIDGSDEGEPAEAS